MEKQIFTIGYTIPTFDKNYVDFYGNLSLMDADILLVDEAIAVGDESFQKKCLAKMAQLKLDGKTILLVSHNFAHIKENCQRIIGLHDGKTSN